MWYRIWDYSWSCSLGIQIKAGKEFLETVYQGGSQSFHLFRNFSKILKSRWKMLLKKLLDRGSFYIFHFYWIFINKYSQLLQKLAEISNVQIFVNDFCTFYKKSLKKSLIFEKFLQEFSWIPTVDYLPNHNLYLLNEWKSLKIP